MEMACPLINEQQEVVLYLISDTYTWLYGPYTHFEVCRLMYALRKDFVILQLYWWLFISTKQCS